MLEGGELTEHLDIFAAALILARFHVEEVGSLGDLARGVVKYVEEKQPPMKQFADSWHKNGAPR